MVDVIRFFGLFLPPQSSGRGIMTEHILPVRSQLRRLICGIAACQFFVLGVLLTPAAEAAQPCPPPVLDAEGGTVVNPSSVCPGSPIGETETPDYNDPVSGV